jgi:hypothetical protein
MSATFLFPSDWPIWARRAFVLTLPISGPLLMAAWALVGVGMGIAVLAAAAVVILTWIGTPVALPIIWLWNACCDLWNASHD